MAGKQKKPKRPLNSKEQDELLDGILRVGGAFITTSGAGMKVDLKDADKEIILKALLEDRNRFSSPLDDLVDTIIMQCGGQPPAVQPQSGRSPLASVPPPQTATEDKKETKMNDQKLTVDVSATAEALRDSDPSPVIKAKTLSPDEAAQIEADAAKNETVPNEMAKDKAIEEAAAVSMQPTQLASAQQVEEAFGQLNATPANPAEPNDDDLTEDPASALAARAASNTPQRMSSPGGRTSSVGIPTGQAELLMKDATPPREKTRHPQEPKRRENRRDATNNLIPPGATGKTTAQQQPEPPAAAPPMRPSTEIPVVHTDTFAVQQLESPVVETPAASTPPPAASVAPPAQPTPQEAQTLDAPTPPAAPPHPPQPGGLTDAGLNGTWFQRMALSRARTKRWLGLVVAVMLSFFLGGLFAALVLLKGQSLKAMVSGHTGTEATNKLESGKTPTEDLLKKVIDASPKTKSGTLTCYVSDWKPDDQEELPRVSCKGSHAPLNHGVDGHACRDISDCVILNVD